ncbi:MAG: DNA polymerase III subunit delta', partial [Thalassolituus sp.]
GLPHALLVSGAGGIGKHELCLNIARWLLCQNSHKEGVDDACGQCHSCHLWAAGTHPDFMICQPEEGSRQIRIDNVRRVNELIFQTPQISRCQVVVMRPAEVMNTNAANALLKTLEEPPGESFILLETERFGSVLPTIRSRCQRISLALPSRDESRQWLLSQGIGGLDADRALQRNGGAPLKAKRWMSDGVAARQQTWTEQLVQWSLHQLPLSQVADKWTKLEFQEVIEWFYAISCDLMKASAGVGAEYLQFAEPVTELQAAVAVDPLKLVGFQEKLQQILGQLLSGMSHHNKTLTIEVLLLEWQELTGIRAGVSA